MPTTHSQFQQTLEDRMSHLEQQIEDNMASLHNEFTVALDQQFKKLVQFFRGKNVELNPK
jgi:hypothetical protein